MILELLVSVAMSAMAAPATEPSPAPPQEPAPTVRPHQAAAMCPVEIPDTKVRYEESPDGATLVFLNATDLVGLRERVGNMAENHNAMHAFGPACPCPNCPQGMSCDQCCQRAQRMGRTPGGGPRRTMAAVPASTAELQLVDGGARLVVKANRPEDVASLREAMKAHAEQLQAGQCPGAGPGPRMGPMHRPGHGPRR